LFSSWRADGVDRHLPVRAAFGRGRALSALAVQSAASITPTPAAVNND